MHACDPGAGAARNHHHHCGAPTVMWKLLSVPCTAVTCSQAEDESNKHNRQARTHARRRPSEHIWVDNVEASLEHSYCFCCYASSDGQRPREVGQTPHGTTRLHLDPDPCLRPARLR